MNKGITLKPLNGMIKKVIVYKAVLFREYILQTSVYKNTYFQTFTAVSLCLLLFYSGVKNNKSQNYAILK
jgi:hypothetical protein